MLQVRCAHPTGTGEPGQPLSPLWRTAPLTQGSRRATPQSAAADSSPYTGEPKGNPSGRCGGQLPPSHRNAPSGRSGVAVGLFPQRVHSTLCSKTLDLQVRCTNPTGNFAPKRPFGTFRCCAWLILRFRTDPPSVRRCSARLIRQAETLELQPLRGLHQATLCSFLQNARASGSLREPYGYRGARATLRAALLREKRPRRRLLRGRWRRGIGIFTASGGCRPVRCGRR